MSLPTAEQVTNMYLYGTLSRPANLLNSSILNHRSSTSPNGISVSAVEYMDSGAGRFVNSANFEIVEKFFSDASLEAKIYTKSEILQYFGYLSPTGEELGYAGYSVNQIFLGTGDADYAERTYIWGTTAFKITDEVEFVVNEDGSREIRNFAIIPARDEDFDFDGGSVSNIGNVALYPTIDPSGVGRTVDLGFTDINLVPRVTLTSENFIQDQRDVITAGGGNPAVSCTVEGAICD